MCFYHDDDPADVYREKIVVGRKQYRCISCSSEISIGEQHIYIFWVADGEPGKLRLCNLCAQDRKAIYDHEVAAGCSGNESVPPWDEIHHLIHNGNGDEEHIELPSDAEYVRDPWPHRPWSHVPTLFWPYGVPPASQKRNLKEIGAVIA